MAETVPPAGPAPRGFPYLTVAAALATFFAFAAIMVAVYRSPNPLDEPRPPEEGVEPKADAATKLNDVRARNQAVLAGSGAKMSVTKATDELLKKLKEPKDTLPFPVPEPPATVLPKKDDKKGGEPK